MAYCKPYPSPCDRCTRGFCRDKKCEAWKTRYLYRQKQINAYAKKCGIAVGEKESAESGREQQTDE